MVPSYVVDNRCPGVEKLDFTRFRLFEVLEERFGLRLEDGRRSFQAQAADRETTHWLNIKPGEPVKYQVGLSMFLLPNGQTSPSRTGAQSP